MPKDTLLIVDVQNDFCPGGTLPVPNGDEVVEKINSVVGLFDIVIASRDWHPPVTNHFKAYGGKWPVHCVHNTWGAKFHSGLNLPKNVIVVSKGMEKDEDAYSAFQGRAGGASGWVGMNLQYILKTLEIDKLFVCGLATDYCVKSTVLDALPLGFKAVVLKDACRAVNLNPGDGEEAVKQMREAGAVITATDNILGYFTPPYE